VPQERDSDEILVWADELATFDAVIDQTDRYRGEGFLRPLVRQVLEDRGARCVGSRATALWRADDKFATKRILRQAGIPVPRGYVTRTPEEALALDLTYPRVIKPLFEHMSRGLSWADAPLTFQENVLVALKGRPEGVLVEEYIPGRELGVTVLDDAVLPVVEWPMGDEKILGYQAKCEGRDPATAHLTAAQADALAAHCLHAFRALGLKKWARFDVRMRDDASFFFLEANAIPSVEAGSPTLVSLAAAGRDTTTLVETLLE
jgi:D-alanine-D-alanine ligase-like ATP-grasp enzyme